MKNVLVKKPVVFTVVIILCAVLGALFSAHAYASYAIAEIRDVPMDVAIQSIPGFNTDTDALHFGAINGGSYSHRNLKVESKETMSVTALAIGNISSLVTVSENNFVVGPDNPKILEITVNAPEDVEYPSFYSGYMRLVFRRF